LNEIEKKLEKLCVRHEKEIEKLERKLLRNVALALVRVKCISNENSRYFLVMVFPPKENEYLPKVLVYHDDRCTYCGANLTITEDRVKCVVCGREFGEGEKIVCSEGHYICNKCYYENTEKLLLIFVFESLVRNYDAIVTKVRELMELGYKKDLDKNLRWAVTFRDAVYSIFENYAEKIAKKAVRDVEVIHLTNIVAPVFGRLIQDICMKKCENKCETIMKLLNDVKMGGRKTVIYFKSKKALEHLLKNGEVYTIRPTKRTEGFAFVKTSKKGKKIAIVGVKYVGEIVLTAPDGEWFVADGAYAKGKLEEFVDKSGFDSVEEWLEEVRKLNGGKLPDRMLLYHVVKVL